MTSSNFNIQRNNQSQSLDFHHVGLLVEDIELALGHYGEVFGKENISEIYYVRSQQVKVCFIKNGKASYLELVQPYGDDSVVHKLLKRRITYYHVAYKVNDIHESISYLEKLNYKSLEVFSSEAFQGNLCVFMFSPEGSLIELIQN